MALLRLRGWGEASAVALLSLDEPRLGGTDVDPHVRKARQHELRDGIGEDPHGNGKRKVPVGGHSFTGKREVLALPTWCVRLEKSGETVGQRTAGRVAYRARCKVRPPDTSMLDFIAQMGAIRLDRKRRLSRCEAGADPGRGDGLVDAAHPSHEKRALERVIPHVEPRKRNSTHLGWRDDLPSVGLRQAEAERGMAFFFLCTPLEAIEDGARRSPRTEQRDHLCKRSPHLQLASRAPFPMGGYPRPLDLGERSDGRIVERELHASDAPRECSSRAGTAAPIREGTSRTTRAVSPP